MKVKVTLVGTHPLVMSNNTLVDPLHPTTKLLKSYSAKKVKTDEDHEKMGDIEFQANMYYDEELGPYIPAENLLASIKDGAKKTKLGTTAERACVIVPGYEMLPLAYKGPRKMEQLLADANFRLRVPVGKKDKKVMSTRPRFSEWACEAVIELQTDLMDLDQFKRAIETAGYLEGIGGYRPKHGRYTVEVEAVRA